MFSDQRLQSAVAQFVRWDRPWTFYQSVLNALTVEEQSTFKAIWNEASDVKLWNSSNLGECANRTVEIVSEKYPTVERNVIEAIVRAVSFEWR